MAHWICSNMGTILISILLILLVVFIVKKLIGDKKKGRSMCGGNCGHCPMGGSCHHK